MTSPGPAIERTWYAVSPDKAFDGAVTLGVSLPQREEEGHWSVVVSMEGIEPERRIFGEDGWQAVELGMRFLAGRVADMSKHGWQFFWTEGGEAAIPQERSA